MILDSKALAAASKVLADEMGADHFQSPAVEAAITAYISALPASEVGYLAERLRHAGPGMSQAVRNEAATALASLSARIETLEDALSKIANGNHGDRTSIAAHYEEIARRATTGGGENG